MLRGYQGMETGSVQRIAAEAEEREAGGLLGRLEFEGRGRNISMRTQRC